MSILGKKEKKIRRSKDKIYSKRKLNIYNIHRAYEKIFHPKNKTRILLKIGKKLENLIITKSY